MLYFWISLAYSLINLGLAVVILSRSRRNVLGKFYAFNVFSLLVVGVSAYLMGHPGHGIAPELLRVVNAFVYSVFPFFFLHFMLVFVRRYEILRSKKIILANYFAGLFSYTLVLLGYVPVPFSAAAGISAAGFIYYLTWSSILFSIGVALAYSLVGGFAEQGVKSNLLFVAFVVLMLLLPTPFTLSVFSVVAGDSFTWYFLSSTAALTVVVFIVFRHRITMNTPYQTMKAALAAMHDALFKTDRDFGIELAQGGVLSLLGYTEEDLRGRRLPEFLLAPERLKEHKNRLLTEQSCGEVFETDVLCSDGSTLAMDFSFTPVFINEEITGFVGVGRNVAERRRAERLKDVVYRIAEAADRADTPDSLYRAVHDIVGEVLPVDKFMIALLDEKRNQIIYPYVCDRVSKDPALGPQAVSLTELVLRTGKPLLSDDGAFRKLRMGDETGASTGSLSVWLGVPLHVRGATIGAMAVEDASRQGRYGPEELRMLEYVSTQVARSIDRKRSEDALRTSEENFRRIFLEDLTGNVDVAPDGRILACNPSFVRMFGFPSISAAQQGNIAALYRDPAARQSMMRLLRKKRKLSSYEEELCRLDGSVLHTIQNIVGIFDEQGELERILLYIIDDTERRMLENQLRQAQKMENLGAMAGGIAHDFNNILTSMSVHLSMIRPGGGPGTRTETALDALSKAVRRGAGLVSQLLTFARKTDVLFESVNVNHAVSELTRMLEATLPKTVSLELRLADGLPTISADPNQLHQAFLNLSVNARDAMPDGGRITIATGLCEGSALRPKFAEAQADPYVVVTVSDTGNGMDQATRNRIFEPFFTTKEKGKGTGLGLAVVYGVVKGHRGFIDVQTEPGRGTSFTLYFHAPDRGVTALPETERSLEEQEPDTGTILLVEDEDLVRESLKALLEERGYIVLCAADGDEAVAAFARAHADIDLVLTDLGLPKRGGWDAFLAMRAIDPAVRAVFATGYVDPGVKAQMVKDGARHFVQKPYVPAMLFEQLREIMAAERKPQRD